MDEKIEDKVGTIAEETTAPPVEETDVLPVEEAVALPVEGAVAQPMPANTAKSNKKKALAVVVCIAVAVIIVLFFVSRPAPDVEVAAGDVLNVIVTASSVEDMYGYQFQMNFDGEEFEWVGSDGLSSRINEIQTIFHAVRDGHILVGATMVGERPGFNGRNTDVCQLQFVAKAGGKISEMSLNLSEVNVVQSDLEYLQNVQGWAFKVEILPPEESED